MIDVRDEMIGVMAQVAVQRGRLACKGREEKERKDREREGKKRRG